ncbi:hypothetical protein [Longispora urticae]
MTRTTPRQAVEALAAGRRLPDGDDERFTGYGIMGMPFASGHYLALRDMVASSVGPAYRALWHRDPAGRWTIRTTAAPELSCPRYFGAATDVERVAAIDVSWDGDFAFTVVLAGVLTWRVQLAATPATRMMTAMGGAMPAAAWTSAAVLASMGPMARAMLRSGRVRLRGSTPNGHGFQAAPLSIWRVAGGAALRGHDLGEPAPLAEQTRLGDFWMPQRGVFFAGHARFAPPAPGTGAGSRPQVLSAPRD